MTCQQQENTSNKRQCLCYFRNHRIFERQIDSTVFLVNSETDTVLYLNQLGTAIWQLLARPTSASEVANIIQQAFPDVSPKQIADDVRKLLNELSAKELALCSD